MVTSNGAHSGHVIGYLGNGNAAGNKTDNFLGIFRNETWPNKLSPDEIETNTLWTRNGSNFEGRRLGVKKTKSNSILKIFDNHIPVDVKNL